MSKPTHRSQAIAVCIVLGAMLSRVHAQFEPGQFITHSQEGWGGDPSVPGSGAALVSERFFFVYLSGVSIGAQTSLFFTSGQAVLNYLPTSGRSVPLNATLVDPTSTASRAFGGYLLALQLDVDFADAGYLPGSAAALGDLKLVDMSSVEIFNSPRHYSAYEGLTVRQFLDQRHTAIATGVAAYSFDQFSI